MLNTQENYTYTPVKDTVYSTIIFNSIKMTENDSYQIQWNLSERTPLVCGHFSIMDDFLGPQRNYYKTYWKLTSLTRTPSIMDTDTQNTVQNVIITL
jgi:hypothetical protein